MPPAPLYTTPDELWRVALAELRLQMTKATYNAWLADSYVLAPLSQLTCLVVMVRNQYAQEWLTCRLLSVITRTLAGIAGHTIDVSFVCENYAKETTINPIKCLQGPPAALRHSLHTKGNEPMTNQPLPSRTRVRLYSHITQSRFLHIEDALSMGKIRLFAGAYRLGQGMDTHAHHFIDLADARVIFGALAHAEPGFGHKEYKGTPPQMRSEPGRSNGQAPAHSSPAVSRVLSIAVKGENLYIELKSGPGKLTSTGAITPNGKPETEVNVAFKLYEARRMAATVLAYIHAWDVMRMMVNQQMISQPSPYMLAPLSANLPAAMTNAAQHSQGAPVNGAAPAHESASSPVERAGNGRPVARKGHAPQNNGGRPKQATVSSLTYANGLAIDSANLTEVQTFQQYVTEKKAVPASKAVLLDYYQQRTNAPSVSTP